ncbi:hypothetical protein M426DRAFT_322514 [Hypoxylon sp. CI-4A]|nr:hypothetical protein M426DRAFT_322514 [Hypoxylon sp. CI-4A]
MATRLPGAIPRRPTTSLLISSSSSLTITQATTTTTAHLKPSHTPLSHTPSRAATIIRRPRRPYQFTQLVQQTDGSTYTMRTTSPHALYKSQKDTRNHVLWQPSDTSLRNVEVDEAGKLAAFRGRFGRGWDAEKSPEVAALDRLEAAAAAEDGEAEGKKSSGGAAKKGDKDKDKDKVKKEAPAPAGDALSDLIASYSTSQEPLKEPTPKKKR